MSNGRNPASNRRRQASNRGDASDKLDRSHGLTAARMSIEEMDIAIRSARENLPLSPGLPFYIEAESTLLSAETAIRNAVTALNAVRGDPGSVETLEDIATTAHMVAETLHVISSAPDIEHNRLASGLQEIREGSQNLESYSFAVLEKKLRLTESEAAELRNLAEHSAHSARRLEMSIEAVEARLLQLDKIAAKEASRIEFFESDLTQLREKQVEALHIELRTFQEEKSKFLAQAQESYSSAINAIREKELAEGREYLDQMQSLLDSAKLTASAVANETIATHYEKSAKTEKTSADNWSKVAFWVGALISISVISIVVISLYRPVEGTFASVLRIFAPLIGTTIFVYATLEARSHRLRAWKLTDHAIAHNTIGAMIAPLPKDMQHELLHQAARKIYVTADQAEESSMQWSSILQGKANSESSPQ